MLASLRGVESTYLERAEELGHDKGKTKEEKQQLRDQWGRELIAAFVEALRRCQFVPRDWCHRHQRMCPLLPALQEGAEHGEVAGTTCVAWSSVRRDSAMGGWLHASSLPCLVWLFWVAAAAPSWFIHECVASYNPNFMCQMLMSYVMETIVFSPTLFGLPANRNRRYSFGIHSGKCQWLDALQDRGFSKNPSEVPGKAASSFFNSMFGRQILVGCELYLMAPAAVVEQYMRDVLLSKGHAVAAEALADMTTLLSGAQFQRLVGYRQLLWDMYKTAPAFQHFVVDLEQTSGFYSRPSHLVPALLTKSSLCVLKGGESIRASAQEDVARMSLPPSESYVWFCPSSLSQF